MIPYLLNGARFKISINGEGGTYCFDGYPQLDGQWVALVDATDNRHLDDSQILLAWYKFAEEAARLPFTQQLTPVGKEAGTSPVITHSICRACGYAWLGQEERHRDDCLYMMAKRLPPIPRG